MRSSPESAEHGLLGLGPLKDERAASWDPARISDRKLFELKSKLERVQRLGGAFAQVDVSPWIKARLSEHG
jgi:hypothetical protein